MRKMLSEIDNCQNEPNELSMHHSAASPFAQSTPKSSIFAGEFSQWLRDAESSLDSKSNFPPVPCGSCTACCRSSMFVHIASEETRTVQRIPRGLLFPAPGFPKGHLLMGYN